MKNLCGSHAGGVAGGTNLGSSANANSKVTAARSRQRTDVIKRADACGNANSSR
ncbi:MAG: hypothetical protein LBE57_06655 [Methanosarcinales archaeon]|nr:hypothetical protein [Methanosarcinales archaeon]